MKLPCVLRCGFVAVSLAGVLLAGCGTDGDCPSCGVDTVMCDNSAGDTSGVDDLIDATLPDTTLPDASLPDTTLPDTTLPDASLPDTIDVQEPFDIGTGTAMVSGRAYFSNMDDHSGFEVRLYLDESPWDEKDSVTVATATTGEDGRFRFYRLPAGTYQIEVSHGPMTIDGAREWGPFGLGDGESRILPDLSFTATGTIEGNVLFDFLYHRTLEAVVFTQQRKHQTVAGTDGAFRLEGVLPGEYRVCAGSDLSIGRCIDGVKVHGLEASRVQDMVLSKAVDYQDSNVVVSGRVTLFGQGDSSGIKVTAGMGGMTTETYTDASGEYLLEYATAGRADISFHAPDESGYEQGAGALHYVLYGGTTERMPDQELVRGDAVWSTDLFKLDARNAEFTPDGRNIVLTAGEFRQSLAEVPAESAIYAVSLDGGTATRLATMNGYFRISPDSKTIAYTLGDADGLKELKVMHLAGGRPVALTDGLESIPEFSPDSRYVIFSRYDPEVLSELQVATYAFDVTSGVEHRLCEGSLEQVTADSAYAVCRSPDGVFTVAILVNGQVLVSTGDTEPIPDGAGTNRISICGDLHTAMICRADGTAAIMNLQTMESVTVPDLIVACDRPVFSPDCGSLIYLSTAMDLNLVPTGGGTPVTLAQGDITPLVFTPDMSRLVYNEYDPMIPGTRLGVVALDGLSEPIGLADDWTGLMPGRNLENIPGESVYIDRASENVWVLRTQAGVNSRELLRIGLDGSGVTSTGPLCNTACATSGLWTIDEDRGLIYAQKPPKELQIIDIETVTTVRSIDLDGGLGDVAANLSGTVVKSGDADAIAWVSFPDLDVTWIGPALGPEVPNSVNPNGMFAISPDGSMILYKSAFGGVSYPFAETMDYRLMLAPLE